MKARGSGGSTLFAVVVLAGLALLAPSGAAAATVVNGGFESGSLAGWQVYRATGLGDWYAYQGTNPPIGGKELEAPVQAPPQGDFAAITDEVNPDTAILYQDVALRPEYDHRLSLLAYYTSHGSIAVPAPDSLSVADEILGERANQQYRIDVIRPEAPIESVDPADILRAVFQTKPKAPEELGPTRLTADLSPFAGQTVRLRIAIAATKETLNAGVDAVTVDSAPAGQPLPPLGSAGSKGANVVTPGKAQVNRANGSAILSVKVPGPGRLSAKAEGPLPAGAAGASRTRKKLVKLIKPVSVKVAKAGTVKLRLRPTAAALGVLELKQKLRVKVAVTFTPTRGSARTTIVPVVLRLEASPLQRR
jgi:hypothetical protein